MAMARTFQDWLSEQEKGLVAKVRAGDEGQKPLVNQVNWILVSNMMDKKSDRNPSSRELLDWVSSGQIDAMRK